PNLKPGADYTLEFTPVYRPGFTFTAPLRVTFDDPELTAFSAERIGQTQVTFHATVDPHGLDTTLELNAANGIAPPGPAIAAAHGTQPIERSLTLSGLRCNTRYSLYLRAGNAAGVTIKDLAFQTLPCAGSAPAIDSVQLGADGNHAQTLVVYGAPNGSTADFAIQYGESGWFGGGESGWQTLSAAGDLTFSLQNLACGTTYHYRAVAYSPTGGTVGDPATFTTAPCQPGTLSISGDTSINAGARTASYTIERSGGSDGRIAIDYAAVGGKAQANREFLQTAGTLVLEEGQIEATVSVPILLSTGNDGGYDYSLTLSSPTGGATLADVRSVRTVIDYPAQPGPKRGGGSSPSESSGTANDVPQASGGAGGLGFIMLATLGALALARRVIFP
ncbi:MAG TPA: hypothetical protein VFK45_02085, partial [Gammaproteobacteria bacterium]|nr:hypothetical protein [Gammaproteobacteria bacterium]